ncbi:hypothetical protein ABID20_000071 [Rhizobium alvei]
MSNIFIALLLTFSAAAASNLLQKRLPDDADTCDA